MSERAVDNPISYIDAADRHTGEWILMRVTHQKDGVPFGRIITHSPVYEDVSQALKDAARPAHLFMFRGGHFVTSDPKHNEAVLDLGQKLQSFFRSKNPQDPLV